MSPERRIPEAWESALDINAHAASPSLDAVVALVEKHGRAHGWGWRVAQSRDRRVGYHATIADGESGRYSPHRWSADHATSAALALASAFRAAMTDPSTEAAK